MVEGVDVEVSPEFTVEYVQHIAVELGGHASRVVVGGHHHRGVGDHPGAQQQQFTRIQRGA